MRVILTGTDQYDLGGAIVDAGHDLTRVDIGNRDALEAASIETADVYVLTELRQATSIPVARELHPGVTVLAYDDGSLPDFASGQADLVLDPALFDPADVAAELDAQEEPT